MRAFAVQSDMNPEIGFALYVHDYDYNKAKKLAFGGLFAWLGDEDLRYKYFPTYGNDDDYWYAVGYFEPTEQLLKFNGIEYLIEDCFDDDGEWKKDFNESVIEEVI